MNVIKSALSWLGGLFLFLIFYVGLLLILHHFNVGRTWSFYCGFVFGEAFMWVVWVVVRKI